jgi:hypothetical protein
VETYIELQAHTARDEALITLGQPNHCRARRERKSAGKSDQRKAINRTGGKTSVVKLDQRTFLMLFLTVSCLDFIMLLTAV